MTHKSNRPDELARQLGELQREIAGKFDSVSQELALLRDSRTQPKHPTPALQKLIHDCVDKQLASRLRRLLLAFAAVATILGAGVVTVFNALLPGMFDKYVGASSKRLLDQASQDVLKIQQIRTMATPRNAVVLQTDFGDGGYYMGALKGAILRGDPRTHIETITADVPPLDIRAAAMTAYSAARTYPAGTVFVVITNPGGTNRDPLALRTSNGFYFLGYNNGCLDLVARGFGVDCVRVIQGPKHVDSGVRDLFGGLKWFALSAADLANAANQDSAFAGLGGELAKYEFRLGFPRTEVDSRRGVVEGYVEQIDGFSNVLTSIEGSCLDSIGVRLRSRVEITVGGRRVPCQYEETFGNAGPKKAVVVVSGAWIMLAVNEGRFAATYGVRPGDRVRLRRVTPS